MSEVATRWHHLCDAVREKRVRTFLSCGGDILSFATDDDIKSNILESYMSVMTTSPRFVVADSAIALIETDQSLLSISDMISCDLLRLPFSMCVVEYSYHNVMYSALLKEFDHADGSREWQGTLFGYRGRCLNDNAALVFPCITCLKIEGPTEAPFETIVEEPQYPTIDYSVIPDPLFINAKNDPVLIEDSHHFVFERCLKAFFAAVLLPLTIGLTKKNIEIKASFNISRSRKGRSGIPNYTYIKVDPNLDLAGAPKLKRETGVSVHLRRAHKRRLAVGEGRTGRVWRFFPPQIVGHLPDGRKPSMPEMLATRGAKPYLLK